MKYLDEFREPKAVLRWAEAIANRSRKPWVLMEICGGQTHNIIKFGLDALLPKNVQLIHGPGCPVCVTPVAMIDAAINLARQPTVVVCTFGDMLRVPGSSMSLATARAEGALVKVVYSPREAVALAAREPKKEVVFFAVGFETTAPANAATVAEAIHLGLNNFSVIVSQVLVPPAMESILSAPERTVQGFLAAGHVCTVTGYQSYHKLAARYKVPIVVTGFEPLDIMQGIYDCLDQLELGQTKVRNQYQRLVRSAGNPTARNLLDEIFEVCDREWRGLGTIPKSGYRLRKRFGRFDALLRFGIPNSGSKEDPACQAGAILQGKLKPSACPSFGVRCRPESPLGAPMVSSEGACAAYYLYKKRECSYD